MHKWIVLWLLLFTQHVHPQENRGSSDLGLCSREYNYEAFISQFKHVRTISTRMLIGTFNALGCPNLNRLMMEHRQINLSVHIINGSGLRTHRLQRHELGYGETVQSLDQKIRAHNAKFLRRFRDSLRELKGQLRLQRITLEVSPCLECNLSKDSRRILLKEVSRVFPGVRCSDNPASDTCLASVLCEKHGLQTKTQREGQGSILDTDGTDARRVDIYRYARENSKAEMIYAWIPCKNGFGPGDGWLPPARRKHFCTKEDNKFINHYLRN